MRNIAESDWVWSEAFAGEMIYGLMLNGLDSNRLFRLQRKYVTIQTMRDRMDIIAKMREECYKFINDSVAREKAMNIEYCDLLDKMNPSEGEI